MATADVLCFVCSASLPAQIDEKLVRRLRTILELEDGCPALTLLEAAFLCTVCNLKLLQIEELITDLKEVYKVKANPATIFKGDDGAPDIQVSQEGTAIQPEFIAIAIVTTSTETAKPDDEGDVGKPCILDDHTYGNKEETDEGPDVSAAKKRKLDCGCGAIFTAQKDLEVHRRDNHGGGIVCRDCGLTLTDAAQIKAHSSAHTSDAFKCIICGEGFSQIPSLKLHQRFSKSCSSHFEVEDDLNCGCGAEFKTPQDFRLHRENDHGGRFACGMCKKTYSSHMHLQRHHQQVHIKDTKEKPSPQRKSQRERKTTESAAEKEMKEEEEQPSTSRLTARQKSLRKTRVSATVKAALADEVEYLDDDNDEDYVAAEEPTSQVSEAVKPTKCRLRSTKSSVDNSLIPKDTHVKTAEPKGHKDPEPGSSSEKTMFSNKSKETVLEFPCPVCDMAYRSWKYLDKHIAKCHWRVLSETEYMCGFAECGQKCLNEQDIMDHARTHRPQMLPCARKDLRKHITQHAKRLSKSKVKCNQQNSISSQDAVDELKCQVCERIFKNQRGFTNHKRHGACDTKKKYKKNREHLCSICGATYATSGCFTEHMASHMDAGDLECEYCQKKFVHKYQLRVHKEQHTRPYMCPQCGKRCSTLAHMQEHQLIHSAELKFSCELCEQRFRWRLSLVRHLWTTHQQGEQLKTRAYKVTCSMCNQVIRSGSRARHFRRNHPTVEYDAEYFTRVSNRQPDSIGNVPESGGMDDVAQGDLEPSYDPHTALPGEIISNQVVIIDTKDTNVIEVTVADSAGATDVVDGEAVETVQTINVSGDTNNTQQDEQYPSVMEIEITTWV